MQQQTKTRTWWGGHRTVMTGALAAALLLTGSALHLGAQPARAECLNLGGGALILSSGGSSCANPNTEAPAVVAPSSTAAASVVTSSVVSSTSGGMTSSTVVASTNDGSATALVQSDGSTAGVLVSQNSDGTTSVVGACALDGAAVGQTLVLSAGQVCLPVAVGAPASPTAVSGLVVSNSSACGAPSMSLGPGSIAMSSGSC